MWKLRLEEFSERRLISWAAGGDREAGEQLVRKHYSSIYGFMMSLTQNRDVAEELVQSTFVSGWQSLSTFRGESSLRTWLHQIAYRQYLRWRKEQARAPQVEQGALQNLESGLVDGMWIRQALTAMPESLAEPFVLHYIQQIPVNEVAEILEIKRGTVLSRLHSARQMMRRLMAGPEHSAGMSDNEDLDADRSQYEMSKASI